MGPLCKSLLSVFHPPVQSPLFQTESMPKLSSIIRSPSSHKLTDFDVKCNSPSFFFFFFSHKKVNHSVLSSSNSTLHSMHD